MLFNSFPFILIFLPIVLGVYFLMPSKWGGVFLPFLIAASLVFYAQWNWCYVFLLFASIGFNYVVGMALSRGTFKHRRVVLAIAITVNLAALFYYKYFYFFMGIFHQQVTAVIVLPLAISFLTFHQVAFLVDIHRGQSPPVNFIKYAASIVFFPHLIAGPIVRYRELYPQFSKPIHSLRSWNNIYVGCIIFFIGLFKKVIMADRLAEFANPVFDAIPGHTLSLVEAWAGVLAFGFQIYFDFSGYSDMAIGLARMFGIYLPLNFNSPYKSKSIIEFWQRWHMTLSRFIRDYVYIPLGGNRRGQARTYVNLMVSMVLVGLWHGANWTFVLWGAFHGVCLTINHMWQRYVALTGRPMKFWLIDKACVCVVFMLVMLGWTIFRVQDISAWGALLKGMLGVGGLQFKGMEYFWGMEEVLWLAIAFVWVVFFANTQELMKRYKVQPKGYFETIPVMQRALSFRAYGWVTTASGLVAAWVVMHISHAREFIYFRF